MSEPEAWQVSSNAAEIYEEKFVPAIFGEWAPRTADAGAVGPGDHVLDVACGTGVVARECAGRVGPAGRVAGLDINDGMLAVARRIRPEVDWRQGDALAIPFDDASFDVVLCQFALMFFPDRFKALGEMWRALKPGGRLAVAVWGPLDEIRAYAVFADLADRHAGPAAAEIARSPFVLGDKAEVADIFAAAGIHNIDVATLQGTERFASIDDMVETEVKGSPLVAEFDAASYAALVDEARQALAFCETGDGRVEIPTVAHIVTARGP